MKAKTIASINEFSGTILIPVFEIHPLSLVPIEFHGVTVSAKVFYGKKDTYYAIEKYDSIHIFIGIGEVIDYKSIKTIFRRISSKYKDTFGKNVALVIPDAFTNEQTEAAISGLYLGTYNLGHFKKTEKHPFLYKDFELQILSKKTFDDTLSRAVKIAKTQVEVYDLVDLPPNVATPQYLSDWARKTGDKFGFSTQILDRQASEEAGLLAFLAVGKGSEKESQFIIMNYIPQNADEETRHVGLVGKGITFDTGGLNIKTAGMPYMKCDMAGGAAVMGAMRLVADLGLGIKVTAIVPCCENSVDSKSFVPSDVIGSYSGSTVEITDTDAEGRLILADGLSYLIRNFKPDTIVDIATLTGSSIGTFGYECAALFTNNENLSRQLQQAGDAIGERMWQLPLWEAYNGAIESEIADVRNYSGKPVAGAISAAKFLEYFTDGHKAWAHLDVAGVAFGDDEFAKTKHATAYGVHLLIKFMENL